MGKGNRLRSRRSRAALLRHRATVRNSFMPGYVTLPTTNPKFGLFRRERRKYAAAERRVERKASRAAFRFTHGY